MFPLSKRLPGENNKSFAYRAIKEGILSLQLPPGQALSVPELAETLKVSSTPIKEALGRLQLANLVEIIPQVGTYVSKINPQFIEEAAHMRFILEKETLNLACKSFPKESMKQLKKNLDLQETLLAEKGTGWDFQKIDKNFHYILFQGNQRRIMWEAITQLTTHYNRMVMLFRMEQDFDKLLTGHQNILSIIERKEIDQVENILREHIWEPIKNWRSFYNKESSYSIYFDFTEETSMLV